jgi:molybdate transport system permease protein
MTPQEWQIAAFTAGMATLSTLFILVPGLALAWVLARHDFRGKSIVETLVHLPLIMPPVATGLILLELFGRNGPIGGWLHSALGIDIVFTWRAVLLAMSVMAFPHLVRAARVGFEQVDQDSVDAARVEGAKTLAIFWNVYLPLSSRAIIAGIIQSFARALGEFGATILVAGNIPGRTTTLSLAIYQHVQMGRDESAFRLVLVSIVLAFAAIWFSERLLKPPRHPHSAPRHPAGR